MSPGREVSEACIRGMFRELLQSCSFGMRPRKLYFSSSARRICVDESPRSGVGADGFFGTTLLRCVIWTQIPTAIQRCDTIDEVVGLKDSVRMSEFCGYLKESRQHGGQSRALRALARSLISVKEQAKSKLEDAYHLT